MNRRRSFAIIVAAMLAFESGRAACADEYKASLNLAANIKFLDTYFGRHGYATTQTIARDAKGFRFKLPAQQGVDHTTVYSMFALAGDFEFSVEYELLNLPRPKDGYGASIGIAVEAKADFLEVQLARGAKPKEGNGYLVTERFRKDDRTPDYKPQHYPSQAKSGRLVLRREKKELICLVADKPNDAPYQLCRLDFNDSTVQKIRVFADPGRFPTVVDGRITNIQVRANEISGGVPLTEQGRSWTWLWITVAILALPALSYWWWRHRRTARK